MHPWHEIGTQISAVTNSHFTIQKTGTVGGGCINQAYYIADGVRRYFVKLNTTDSLCMFEAEAAGLTEIHQSRTIRVPLPVCYGKNAHSSWLVLEYINTTQAVQKNARGLGMQLAAMHRIVSKHYGWIRDNTIGRTPQINTLSSDWIAFWRIHRLGYQLDVAKTNGFTGKLQALGEQLLINLDQFFPNHSPSPSLLHGDLWNGNYTYDEINNPVLFDPAVYYGDRETDIAMTELFGGFPNNFYSAYQHHYPLDSGYNLRKVVYNLYHILNHMNLFGSSYRHQAEQMMSRLLTEIR